MVNVPALLRREDPYRACQQCQRYKYGTYVDRMQIYVAGMSWLSIIDMSIKNLNCRS